MKLFTLTDMIARLDLPVDASTRKALSLGLASDFLGPRWGGPQFGTYLQPMFAAAEAGRYEFYFDAMGRCVGLVDWTLVNPDTCAALLAHGPQALASKHDAGPMLWIIDFFAYAHSVRAILADLRDRVLCEHGVVTYFRYRGTRRIVKQISRQDRSAFFRTGLPATQPDQAALIPNEGFLDGYHDILRGAIALGECMLALRRSDPHLRSPLWAGSFPLRNLRVLEQVRVYRDARGLPAGLLTWAWVSDHTLGRLSAVPLHDVDISEWNEGMQLCLCDVLATEPVRAQIAKDLAGELFPAQQTILLYTPPYGARKASVQRVNRASGSAALLRWAARVGSEKA